MLPVLKLEDKPMTAVVTMVAGWIGGFRQRRRGRLGERIMNDLPTRLQRDVDWDAFRRR